MIAAARTFSTLTWPIPGSHIAAALLAIVGFSITTAGVVEIRKSKTTVNPFKPGAATIMVSEGVYRYSRNPMYLGLLVVLAGLTIYLSNAVVALFVPAFVLYLNEFQIKPEERALAANFGAEYARYKSTVPRWAW